MRCGGEGPVAECYEHRNFEFHWRRGISSLGYWLSASQEGLGPMELVYSFFHNVHEQNAYRQYRVHLAVYHGTEGPN